MKNKKKIINSTCSSIESVIKKIILKIIYYMMKKILIKIKK